jgi:hypothetical protein
MAGLWEWFLVYGYNIYPGYWFMGISVLKKAMVVPLKLARCWVVYEKITHGVAIG